MTPPTSLPWCLALGPPWPSSLLLPSQRCSSHSPCRGEEPASSSRLRSHRGPSPRPSPQRRARAAARAPSSLACTTSRGPTRSTSARPMTPPCRLCTPSSTATAPTRPARSRSSPASGDNVRQLDTLAPGERAIENPAITVGQGITFNLEMWATTDGTEGGPRVRFGNGQTQRFDTLTCDCPIASR